MGKGPLAERACLKHQLLRRGYSHKLFALSHWVDEAWHTVCFVGCMASKGD
jgi:hypothetical protein